MKHMYLQKIRYAVCYCYLCLFFKFYIKEADFLVALELGPGFPGKVIQMELFYGNYMAWRKAFNNSEPVKQEDII